MSVQAKVNAARACAAEIRAGIAEGQFSAIDVEDLRTPFDLLATAVLRLSEAVESLAIEVSRRSR